MGSRKWEKVIDINGKEKNQLSNEFYWKTYREIGLQFKNFGFGLKKLLKSRDSVGICSINRSEWLVADFGCIVQVNKIINFMFF